jgi:hypothetical protein
MCRLLRLRTGVWKFTGHSIIAYDKMLTICYSLLLYLFYIVIRSNKCLKSNGQSRADTGKILPVRNAVPARLEHCMADFYPAFPQLTAKRIRFGIVSPVNLTITFQEKMAGPRNGQLRSV